MRSIGDFSVLPRESLASRFGKDALNLMAKIWGEGGGDRYASSEHACEHACLHAWPGFHPAARIIEREEVRDPEAHGLFHDLEGATFVLRGLVDRSMGRLRGRCERVSSMEIRFHPGNRRWRVDLPLPQGSTSGLLPILRERLAHELGKLPLLSPVEVLEIEVTESVPGMGSQRDFFSKKEEEREAWDGLVARLSQKLGKDRVFVAFPQERYLPERGYVRRLVSVPSVLSKSLTEAGGDGAESEVRIAASRTVATLDWAERPARVLKKAEPLLKEGRVLCGAAGKQWKVVSWEGPERISGEWWKSPRFEGFKRDYYRVMTEGGEQLWVYVDHAGDVAGKDPSFFLHGYFD